MDERLIDGVVADATTTTATTDATTTATTDATTTATTPKPRRTRTATTPKPASTTIRTIRTAADIVSVARTVTTANFATLVARHTANHGVSHAARNVGRFTGSRIMDAQNVFMMDNHGLNDVQILWAIRIDFPAAVGRVFTDEPASAVGIIGGIRAEYNRNGHGSKTETWKTVKSVRFGPARFEWPKPATAVKTA